MLNFIVIIVLLLVALCLICKLIADRKELYRDPAKIGFYIGAATFAMLCAVFLGIELYTEPRPLTDE